MLRFKRFIAAAVAALAIAAMPHVCASSSTVSEPPENLHGFADLYWGETLREVQGEYKTGFVEYAAGGTRYFIEIPEAHGFLGFEGEAVPVAHFAAGRLESLRLSTGEPAACRSKLTGAFGEPEVIKGKEYTSYLWSTRDSTILLRAAGKSGTLFLFKNN